MLTRDAAGVAALHGGVKKGLGGSFAAAEEQEGRCLCRFQSPACLEKTRAGRDRRSLSQGAAF